MSDYSIAISGVPVGERAVAAIDTLDSGSLSDIDSITVAWRDQNGLLLSTLTRTSVDVSGADIYGNAVDLTDPAGTGNYQARLIVDPTHYSPPASGFTWTATVTAVKGAVTSVPTVFRFQVIPTTITIGLDAATVATGAMRQVGLLEDVAWVSRDTNKNLPLQVGAPVYDLAAAYKNGVPMARPTDYAWSLYQPFVVLAVSPTTGDSFVFTVQKRSSIFVADIVNRAISEVRSSLQPHFDTAALVNSPTTIELAKAIVIGQLKQDLSQGSPALESAHYRSGKDLQEYTRMQIRRIQRGEETLYDTAGKPLPRKAGSLVGYFPSPLGPIRNRADVMQRGRNYQGVLVVLRPVPVVEEFGGVVLG